jgi:hypothetical protein
MSNDFASKLLAMDHLATEFGMHQSYEAVKDFQLRHAEYRFETNDDGVSVLIHTPTGEPAASTKHLVYLHETRSYLFPQKDEESLLAKCFGPSPSLTARGILRAQVGEQQYRDAAKAWSSDPVKLTPGRKPDDAGTVVPLKPRSTNPWSAEGWDLAKQRSVIASLGVAKGQQLAAAANSFVGATKPGAKQLIPRTG